MSASKNLEYEKTSFLNKSNSAFIERMYLKFVNKDADLPDSWKDYFEGIGEELNIIASGSIWYRKATVKDTAVEFFGNTAIVWNRITLDAVVREQVVVTEFTVTEVYHKQDTGWKMLNLTFSSVRDTHQIKH